MQFPYGHARSVASAVAQWLLRGRCASGLNAAVLLCLPMLAIGTAQRALAQTLTLHYQERAPYSTAQADGTVAGLAATPATQAVQRAGLSFVWARTPGLRQLALIQEGEGLHCGVGWFRNAERSASGKFSKALYRDHPFGALVRSDSPLRDGMRSDEAMTLAGAALLVKEGYSYGTRLDRLIAQLVQAPIKTSVETLQMVRMLLAGRAGWMIVSPEESSVLRESMGASASALRNVTFIDMPDGETRHLYCNRAVPDAWLARIDQSLPTTSVR